MAKKIRIPKLNKFSKNVFVLAGGTMFSQLLILLTLPVLAHLYTPAEFGVFSVYTSIVSLILVISSLSYEVTVTMPSSDRAASSLVHLSLYLCMGISLLSGLVFYLLQNKIADWLNASEIKGYFFLVIFSLFAAGVYQVLNYWLIRKKHFKQIARTKYMQSTGQVATQLTFGIVHHGSLGLIVGDLVGRSAGIWGQLRRWRKDTSAENISVTWEDMKDNAYRYRRFPLLSSGSSLLNSFSLYLPNILLAALYGPYEAGLYTLVQRLLGAPAILISTSVSQVYLSEFSSNVNHRPEKIYPLFMGTLKKVTLIGLLVIGSIVVIAPHFMFLLGDQWHHTGHLLPIMAMMYIAQFAANSVGSTIDVMERQDLHLLREIVRIIIVTGALYLAWFTNQDPETAVLFLSIAATLGYLLHLSLSYRAVIKFKQQAPNLAEVSTSQAN